MFVCYIDSGAKVLDKDVDHEVDGESSAPKQSKLRRANVTLLADEDNRYSGKRISRKSLEGSSAKTSGKVPGGRLKHFIIMNHIYSEADPGYLLYAKPIFWFKKCPFGALPKIFFVHPPLISPMFFL